MHESDIRTKLSEAGLRVTYPRLALIGELARGASQPKSAAELSATLSQFPRSSVYRNLEALETAHLIKSSMIKWVRRYELGDELAPHHHHIACTSCQKLIQFDSHKLESQLRSIAEEHHFQLMAHSVELHGLCKDCQTSPEARSTFGAFGYGIDSLKRFGKPRQDHDEAHSE